MGVGHSGAADLASHDAANRLVGNDIDAATLEVTFGGLELRADRDIVVAVTGARVTPTIDGAPQGSYCTLALRAGSVLALSTPTSGVRSYVAIRGGIDAPRTLGSRSTDTLSGLGPPPVQLTDVLHLAREYADWPAAEQIPKPRDVPKHFLRVSFGPRDDWFTAGARRLLLEQSWTVTEDADRVGIRLDGARPLDRAIETELPSEGMVTGALQVPPSGKPVLFLADHPVTGGYPVIAVVCSADLPSAAQLTPGQSIEFRPARAGS